MKKTATSAGGGATLSNAQKGRSEEQIHTAQFPVDLVKKALKEKSQSQSAIRVGPFAAIREAECEKRRQKNGSLDLMDESGEGGSSDMEVVAMGERAATMNGGVKQPNSRK